MIRTHDTSEYANRGHVQKFLYSLPGVQAVAKAYNVTVKC